jgi:heme/copper-type cytochrome/quinol oxidase subunit 3
MRQAMLVRPNHNSLMQTTLVVVLGAETVLFGTLVMTFLFLRGGGSDIPFVRPGSFDVMIAGMNTLILLASTAFAWNGRRAIAEGRADRLIRNLVFALILGLIFIAGQVFEFNHSGMRVDDSAFGGVFFALTSFHALHVLAGMTVLSLNLVRARLGDFSAHSHVAVTAGTWFWYYVAAIWIVLFTVLYVV